MNKSDDPIYAIDSLITITAFCPNAPALSGLKFCLSIELPNGSSQDLTCPYNSADLSLECYCCYTVESRIGYSVGMPFYLVSGIEKLLLVVT